MREKWIGMTMLLGVSLVFISPPASSQSASEISKLDPAWRQMERRVRDLLGSEGQKSLLDMAYAQVAVDACPGWVLDRDAVSKALDDFATKLKRAPEDQRAFDNEMMNYLGVYTGLLIAESFIDHPAFCKGLKAVVLKKDGPSRWLHIKLY
jgi:hypothetical protein